MAKQILIAGGTGFVGYHLAKACIKKKWIVTSISSTKPKKKRFLVNVKYIILDLSKKKNLNKFLNKKFDYVVNLSGHVNHKKKNKVFSSHYLGTKNLIDFFKKKKIEYFIQIGSSSEYGKTNSPQKENFKCNPKSYYGKAKFLATKYAISIYKRFSLPIIVLRPYQIFGPKQDLNRLIPIVINGCIEDKSFPCSDGNQFRDFLYVNDFVELIFKIFKSKNKSQLIGNIFNVGSGKPLQIKNVILKIHKLIKKGNPIFGKIRLRKDENLICYPDVAKVYKLIKWRSIFSFNRGLKLTIGSH